MTDELRLEKLAKSAVCDLTGQEMVDLLAAAAARDLALVREQYKQMCQFFEEWLKQTRRERIERAKQQPIPPYFRGRPVVSDDDWREVREYFESLSDGERPRYGPKPV